MRNLQFLNMGSNSGLLCQKLLSLFHAISLFLIQFFSYISRLQKFGFSSKNNEKDMILVEAGQEDENNRDKSELLHLKFKFPSFDEFSRIRNVRDDSHNPKFSSSALIEVLATFPLREINGDKESELSDEGTEYVEQREKEAIVEFAEIKVDLVLEDSVDESDISSDGFLSDGESFGENKESPMFLGEIKKVEEQGLENGVGLSSDFLSEKDFKVNSDKKTGEGFLSVDDMGLLEVEGALVGSSRAEKDCSPFDNDRVTNKLESLWEHQELIEQLQMELRKVKATGLPTIAEESETPKVIDDLKPWKIDEYEELQHQDCIGELHRFYKSYREMMRKFDILNYQKMYAMG